MPPSEAQRARNRRNNKAWQERNPEKYERRLKLGRMMNLMREERMKVLARRCTCVDREHVIVGALHICLRCEAIWHRSGSNATSRELAALAAAVRAGIHPALAAAFCAVNQEGSS